MSAPRLMNLIVKSRYEPNPNRKNNMSEEMKKKTALEILAKELDIPSEHIREVARAMSDEKIIGAAKCLYTAFFVMLHDWKNGDFDLPALARIHMEEIECKAVKLGRLLFRRKNINMDTSPPLTPHDPA